MPNMMSKIPHSDDLLSHHFINTQNFEDFTEFQYLIREHDSQTQKSYLAAINAILKFRLEPTKTILDIGCCAELGAIPLNAAGYSHTGYLGNRTAIEIVTTLANSENVDVNFILGSIRKMDVKGKTYDMTLCLDNVISDYLSIDLQDYVLEKISATVKEGGIIAVSIGEKEKFRKSKNDFSTPFYINIKGKRFLVIRSYDYDGDSIYTIKYFIIDVANSKNNTKTFVFKKRISDLKRIENKLRELGFLSTEVISKQTSGFWQDILIGIRGND